MSDSAVKEMQKGFKVTLIGALVNLFLVGFKLAGGLWGNSQALIADAVHSISDLFTDVVVVLGLIWGRKKADQDHPFGHARLETLASAVIGLSLLVVGAEIGYGAGRDIFYHKTSHPTGLAVIIAALAIVSKEILYQYTVRVGRKIKSPAVIANAWHHRTDAFSSIAVLLGVTAAWLKPDWHILDAYAALFVSIFIIKAGFDVLLSSIREFTDTAPGPEVIEEIEKCARGVTGVKGLHDMKVRTSGGRLQMELHVVVKGSLTVVQGHDIAKAVENCLLSEIENAEKIIIHIDPDESENESGPSST